MFVVSLMAFATSHPQTRFAFWRRRTFATFFAASLACLFVAVVERRANADQTEVEEIRREIGKAAVVRRQDDVLQTGLAKAFPGMVGRRLPHTRGVGSLNLEILRRFELQGNAIGKDVQLVGVLGGDSHDIGHLWNGHMTEQALKALGTGFCHEYMGCRAFAADAHSYERLVGKVLFAHIQRLVAGTAARGYEPLATLMHASLGTDGLNWVRRDAREAGVASNAAVKQTVDSIADAMVLADGKLAVRREALPDVLQFLALKDRMYKLYRGSRGRAVYAQRFAITRRARDLVGDKRVLPHDHPFALLITQGHEMPLDAFMQMTDPFMHHTIAQWVDGPDEQLREHSRMLLSDKLPEAIELPAHTVADVEQRNEVVEAIGKLVRRHGGRPNDVLLDIVKTGKTYKNGGEQVVSHWGDKAPLLVYTKGKVTPIAHHLSDAGLRQLKQWGRSSRRGYLFVPEKFVVPAKRLVNRIAAAHKRR